MAAVFDVSQLGTAGHGSRYGATTHPAVVPLPSYTPSAGGSPILWGAAVLRLGGTVYVYGTQSPKVSDPLHHLYLASAGSGQVRLDWPDTGLGIRYLVYLHAPGQPGGDPVVRTYRDGVTLTGLRPGRYVARVVPANFRKYRGRGAETTFTVR